MLDFQTGHAADLRNDQSGFSRLILNNAAVTPCPTTIHTVLAAFDLLVGVNPVTHKAQRQVFAVDETGDQPGQSDGGHRFIIAQRAGTAPLPSGGGGILALAGPTGASTVAGDVADADILLAPLEGSPGMLDTNSLEVISYDASRGVNVFYKFQGNRWTLMGNGAQIDPQHSQDVQAQEGQFFCQSCHPTGALNFKERELPWNNWNTSFAQVFTAFRMPGFATADPLLAAWFAGQSGGSSAPGVANPAEPKLGSAYTLQSIIENGNKRLVTNRVQHVLAHDGTFPNQSLKTLIRELMCDVGEVNLSSSTKRSRGAMGDTATSVIDLPAGFLVDETLQATVVSIPNGSYQKAITQQSIQDIPGANDTMFGLFVPQRSFTSELVANDLVKAGVLTQEALNDILMTDFTSPMFSSLRCALASTVPDDVSDASFLGAWITALNASPLSGATKLAAQFGTGGQLTAQKAQVAAFIGACQARATNAPDDFAVDAVSLAAQRRAELRADAHLNRGNQGFPQIIESPDLFPKAAVGATPGALHLQADCTLGTTAPTGI